jgi:hypothetical protein
MVPSRKTIQEGVIVMAEQASPNRGRVVIAVIVCLVVSLTAVAMASADSGKPKKAITKAAQARANRIVLHLSDFGSGWRAEKDEGDDSSSKCWNSDLSALTVNGDADSPDFVHGDLPLATSTAGVFASAGQARKAFITLRSALGKCLVGELEKQSGIDDVSGGQLRFPRLGDASTAFEAKGQAKGNGLSVDAYFDVVVIQRERAVAMIVFADVVDPFDESMKERLARAVARRMAPATVAAAPARFTFTGSGGKTLPPISISKPATLHWVASGGIFQIFVSGSAGGDVNSQARSGATYLAPGRYKLQINAIGIWRITIAPGVERPHALGAGRVGFTGSGGRTLPPFSTRRGTTLRWRASGGLFQLFSDGTNGPEVNSQAASGTTYMDSGRHQVTVNALGAWTIAWRP